MQKEIDQIVGLARPVAILGVNQVGQSSQNDLVCEGRDIPWLQETAEHLVWSLWEVAYRDVVILDEDNEEIARYNLTSHDLQQQAAYDELKGILLGAAQ